MPDTILDGGAAPESGAAPADGSNVNPNGNSENTAPSWRDGLSEDLRGNEAFANFGTVDDFAKDYLAKAANGDTTAIKLPTDDADDAAWGDLYNKLGRPETADKYEMPDLPEGTPENLQGLITNDLAGFKDIAHKAGLSSKQMTAVASHFSQSIVQADTLRHEAEAAEVASVTSALESEWGDKYASNVDAANRAITQIGGKEFVDVVTSSSLGRNEHFIKAMARLGSMMKEDSTAGSTGPANVNSMTAVQAEITRLSADPAYLDPTAPTHKNLQAKVQDLYKQMYK